MDIKEIKQIVDLMKRSDLTEFSVEEENFKLQIKRATDSPAQQQVVSYAPPAPVAAASPAPTAEPIEIDNSTYITSPMVGTFYAAASPESPSFANIGDSVKDDSVVCIIEAMKIMNEIQAETSGKIVEALVENGQPVEFGQKLFRLA